MKISKAGNLSEIQLVNIDDLTTSSKVAECLRSQGKNIIPIVAGTKTPYAKFELMSYFDKKCDVPIRDSDSIAILHGKISNTYAIDIDMKNGEDWKEAVNIIVKDIEKILSTTMVIKTPKQGCHIIVSPNGDLPPKNAKYFNSDNVEIDIKTQGGYTLLPPSIHPEKHLGRYQFVSSTLETNPTSWIKFEAHLASKGFFLKEDIENKDLHNDYDLDKLLCGKFIRGTRRKSLNSLYCKMRVRRWSEKHCVKKIKEVNRKLAEPLSEVELEYNIKYSESFFINHVKPSLSDYKSNEKLKEKKSEKFTAYKAAYNLMEEYTFVSHISGEIYYYANGIYRKNGKILISKKCRQYWEIYGIDTTMINEIINIIRDKTTILSDDDNQEIFDMDYTKLILKNGMYDFELDKFSDYNSKIISTIKHPIYYDELKTCPKFEKFLESCFDGDKVRIIQVWEMMALCFIKKYIIQKGYVNYGIGSNGKSTFLSILRNMLGIQTTSSIPMQLFQKSQFIGHELRGKCANISADGGTEPIIKTGFIKSVLGGDAIRCEEKFRSAYDYMPFVTLIFTFNELPIVMDSSDGFARKIQTIHWDQRFYGDKRDKEVDKLSYNSDERSGIFNKLIPIINRLLDTTDLSHESSVEDTKAVWLSRSDSFFRFKNEKIVIGAEYKISTKLVKDEYIKFCDGNSMTALGGSLFHTKIREMLNMTKPTKTRINSESVYVWNGFTLDSELRGANQPSLD